MLKTIFYSLVLIAYLSSSYAQEKTTIHCYLQDEQGQAIQNGSVTVRMATPVGQRDSIYFLRPDAAGSFQLVIASPEVKIAIEINSLGYEKLNLNLNTQSPSPRYIVLHTRKVLIDEIKIQAPSGIKVNKDTIRYDVAYFTDNNENKIEELIQKLPGMHVDEDGNIRHNNKLISRVMLEGDDLFDERYKMLTKNLSAAVVGEVEVISNYHPNALLAKAGEGNESILNLRLKDKKQFINQGNAQIGQGLPEGRHNYSANYIGISPLVKAVVLASSNNIGEDPVNFLSGERNPSIQTANRRLEPVEVSNLFSLDSYRYKRISEKRNNFNQAKLISANFLFKPHQKLSLKSAISYVKDRKQQELSNQANILDISGNINYHEKFKLRDSIQYLQYGLEATWDLSENSRLYYNGKFRFKNNQQRNQGYLDNRSFEQYAAVEEKVIEQRLQFTHNLGSKWLFDSELLYYHLDNPNALQVAPELLLQDNQDAENHNTANFSQYLKFPVAQFSWANRFLNKTDRYTAELSATFHHQKHNYSQTIATRSPSPETNTINRQLENKRIQLGASFRIKIINQLSVKAETDMALEAIRMTSLSQISDTKEPVGTAKLSAVYEMGKGSLLMNYGFSKKLPSMIDFLPDYRMLNYRIGVKGLDHIRTTTNNMLNLGYSYADYDRAMLFANFTLGLGSNSKAYLTQTNYSAYYQISSLVDHKSLNTPYLVAFGKLEKYIPTIRGNAYLDFEYLSTKAFNISNDRFNSSNVHNLSFDFGLKTAWDNFLNLQLSVKPNMTYLQIDSEVSRDTYTSKYLETAGTLYFRWSKKFNSQVLASYLSLPDRNRQLSLFLMDFKSRYIFKKDKLYIDISATNIWNEKTLTFTQFNQSREDTMTYNLMSNNYMLSLYYSF